VRAGKGERAAQLIDDLKTADMAREAGHLLDGTGELPEPLLERAPQRPPPRGKKADMFTINTPACRKWELWDTPRV
jgi:hypothetical protein